MTNFPIQPYDLLMLAVLVLSTLFGLWKGMAWQLTALASILVSAGVASHLSGPLAPYFSDQAPWNRCIAMLVIYVVTSLGIWLVFRAVSGAINRVQLKEFDRQLGALFGAAKGVLWCIVITFFAVTLSEPARQTILKARSGYYIAKVTERAAPVLPQEVRSVLGKYIEELDRKLDPSTPPDGTGVNNQGESTTVNKTDSPPSASQGISVIFDGWDWGADVVPLPSQPGTLSTVREAVARAQNELARAGREMNLSDIGEVWLARPGPVAASGQPGADTVYPVPWSLLPQAGSEPTDPGLRAGDRVFVSRRGGPVEPTHR